MGGEGGRREGQSNVKNSRSYELRIKVRNMNLCSNSEYTPV